MTETTDPQRGFRAVFTVTIETRKGGDYYFDHDDLVRNVTPWIEGALEDRDDIRDVTVVEAEPDGPAAVPSAPADRAGLQEEIAEALMRWAERNNDPQYAAMRRSETVRANAYGRADAALPAPADRAALSDTERQFLTYALDLAADQMASRGNEFGDEDTAALAKLRRMADEAQQPKICELPHLTIAEEDACEQRRLGGEAQQPETQDEDRAAIIAEILPTWEAVYEPGNVSDYLIGYANSEAGAKGAAEAWLRSEKDEPGRLEWVPQTPLDGYDQESELIERHDDGIDTGPGITVRHRIQKPSA